jgi:nucleoside-diphosphate-sugar epimerase
VDQASYTVLGATSIVGRWLCHRLATAGVRVECVTRRATELPLPPGCAWRRVDLVRPDGWLAAPGSLVISLMPIWILPEVLPTLIEARQIVALSTTSIATKTRSRDPEEQALARRVAEAEAALERWCAAREIPWTILRPTLIYSPWQDQNVSAIARFIDRFRFFVVAHPGTGLRQPVHADDVAAALVASLQNPAARNRVFAVPGGETLAYRDMVVRIFAALRRRPVVVALPAALLRRAFAVLRIGRSSAYSPALFDRMNQDLVFDAEPARRALGYRPRPFEPDFGPVG